MRKLGRRVLLCALIALMLPSSTGVRAQEPKDHWQAEVGEPTRIKLYFVRNDRLAVVHRVIAMPEGKAIARATTEALLLRVTPREHAFGVGSAIPPGTDLVDIQLEGDTLAVVLSGQFLNEGWIEATEVRLAQVVYTLTQFPNVRRVRIDAERVADQAQWEAPEIVAALGQTFTRQDLDDHLDSVFFEEPAIGDVVASPFRAAGYANVFEGGFTVSVLDLDGRALGRQEIAGGFGRHHGTFDVEISFDADAVSAPMVLLRVGSLAACGDCPWLPDTVVVPLWLE